MFAIDGVKLPSNASKQKSGTRTDFARQAERYERAAQGMLARYRRNDTHPVEADLAENAPRRRESGMSAPRTSTTRRLVSASARRERSSTAWCTTSKSWRTTVTGSSGKGGERFTRPPNRRGTKVSRRGTTRHGFPSTEGKVARQPSRHLPPGKSHKIGFFYRLNDQGQGRCAALSGSAPRTAGFDPTGIWWLRRRMTL